MQKTARIKRVRIGTLFKVAFVLYAILGLVAGLFYGFVFAVLGELGVLLGEEDIPGMGLLTGALGVLAAPVLDRRGTADYARVRRHSCRCARSSTG